jgi:N-acetylmuramoyl-L-alanine amidase
MPDDNNPLPPDNLPPHTPNAGDDDLNASSDMAPSTIFVEMMRQAAARRAAAVVPPAEEAPTPAPLLPEAYPPLPEDATLLFGDNVVISDPDMPRRRRPRRRATDPIELAPDAPPVSPPPSQPETPPVIPEFADLHHPSVPLPPVNPPPVIDPPQHPTELFEQEYQAAALEEQRIQRVKRRQERRRRRRVGMMGGFMRTALIVIFSAGLASTIFTWFTQPDFINPSVASGLQVAVATGIATVQPTLLPTPNWLRKVGIVSGHRGPQNDPGAVCPDGLTEAEINFAVATLVVRNLRGLGYSVDLLDEFDPRLDSYQAAALVSIHANTCQDFGQLTSGYLVAKAAARPEGGLDSILAECVADHYGRLIQMERRFTLTIDMTDYHTFREIHPLTPAAIIELGFMKDDREILTTRQDEMAQGITEGILCFLEPSVRPGSGVVTVTPGGVPVVMTATP